MKTATKKHAAPHAARATDDQETTMTDAKTAHTTESATQTHEETTMKKTAATSATTTTTTPAGTTTSGIPAQLQALEESCGYADPLPDATRRTSESLVRRVPDTIVDRVIALAARGKGEVAGIKFDPVAAQAALAKANEADAVVTAGKILVRRAQDESTRQRASIAGQVSAIRVALRGYAKTAQGAPLAREVDELASLTKQHRAIGKGLKTRTLNGAAKEAAAKGGAGSPPDTVPAETPAVKPATPPTAS